MNIQDLFNLDKKIAFISGGATGIGRMAAEAMAMAGARVLIASRKGSLCASIAAVSYTHLTLPTIYSV